VRAYRPRQSVGKDDLKKYRIVSGPSVLPRVGDAQRPKINLCFAGIKSFLTGFRTIFAWTLTSLMHRRSPEGIETRSTFTTDDITKSASQRAE
jgi:hypothetical protein